MPKTFDIVSISFNINFSFENILYVRFKKLFSYSKNYHVLVFVQIKLIFFKEKVLSKYSIKHKGGYIYILKYPWYKSKELHFLGNNINTSLSVSLILRW